ncbi:MAG: exosortase/archaeosortase family protein [Phycisphaerae bacterium]
MTMPSESTTPAMRDPPPNAAPPAPRDSAASRARTSTATGSLLDVLGSNGLIRLALLGGATAWLFWDQLVRLVRIWSSNPDWSHGFLIPFFSLYFINSKRDVLARTPVRGNWLGLPIVLFAILGYFYCVRAKIGSPQALMIVIAIAGLTLLACGWKVMHVTGFPIAFLVLALPPPEYKYRELTQPLQQLAAFAAEQVLRIYPNVFVIRSGINIAFDNVATGLSGSFTVAGACSGMRSLMAFVALGLAMAYFSPRPMWHRVTIALAVVPVAVFCNVVRVIVTGTFQIYNLGDLAKGTPHTLTGIATFALGFAIYFAILWILDHLFIHEPDEPQGATP